MSTIYLDYNRTTPTAPSVVEAMRPFWGEHFYLPGQEHPHAQATTESLENAREQLSFLVGCDPFELVYTSGGTEANNLGILGATADLPPGHVLCTPVETEEVDRTLARLAKQGWTIEALPCDEYGRVSPQTFASRLRSETTLACVQLANPTLGTIQPVSEISELCRKRGVHLHCDASQGFGKISVDACELGADTLALSGHKFYGPKGTGALYIRRGLRIAPITYGEPREMGLRAGSENVPGYIGLGTAAAMAARCASDAQNTYTTHLHRLLSGLQSSLNGGVLSLSDETNSLPNTVCLELPVAARDAQRRGRDLVFTTGRSSNPPDEMTRVLRAVGRTESQIARTVAISLGWTTSRDQIDRTVELLAEACDSA